MRFQATHNPKDLIVSSGFWNEHSAARNRLARGVLFQARASEAHMKLAREFKSEQQAQAQELALKTAGYQAWRNQAPDGNWLVFWVEPSFAPAK
jgi:hypothetical protein